MSNENKTAVRPGFKMMVSVNNARAIKDANRRTAARKAYRAKIESLLDKSRDEQLAQVWQQVYPLPIDPGYELPDRRGIIADMADFAEILQPSLNGMKADRLCRLIEKYAASVSRQPDRFFSRPARMTGTPNYRAQRENCIEPAATLHG